MSHVRKQIRDAAVTALTGLSIIGARVFPSRLRPLSDGDLPCLLVNTGDEQVVDETVGGDVIQREMVLRVRGVAKLSAGLDDLLDDIAEQVEIVLDGNRLGGLVKSCNLQSIADDTDDTLEKPAGIITLEFKTVYFTASGFPGTPL